jgi:hypothetical protein
MRISLLIVATLLYGCKSIQVKDTEKMSFDISSPNNNRYAIGDNRSTIPYLVDISKINDETIKDGTLTIELIDENRVRLTFKFADKQIDKVFKGRLRKNEFKLRNRIKVKLFPPIFWTLIGDSGTIFKNENGDLTILGEHAGGVFLTLIPIGGTSNGRMTGTFTPLGR